MAIEITTKNFQTEVVESKIPVLLDFWATWCGPCRMVAPVIDRLHDDYAGKAIIGKINVDENPDLAAQHQVMSIPTIIVMHENEVVERVVGSRSYEELAGLIDKYL